VISGAETELDKSMVERISDPLMHLVRNAIDHGIEPAATREARGKSARGKVFLNAYHDSGSIVIEVGDDGGGLDKDRILKKAIERGLAAPGQALVEGDIHKLIMEPGFSTAEQVSNLSGRGVGMDVVKRNIEALRGTVEIDSVAGKGTTVRMRLPLTLAIIDGFLVRVGNASYVVPLDMVVECLELGDRDLQASEGRNYVNLRGEVLPFVRLRGLFEMQEERARRENIVVVQYGGQKAGIVVDRLVGELQAVIKPLSRIFAQLKGIGGSTILGSGEVALILDVPALIQLATSNAPAGAADRQRPPATQVIIPKQVSFNSN
jgi:two-component system chemotaxis sensor kinase CheA